MAFGGKAHAKQLARLRRRRLGNGRQNIGVFSELQLRCVARAVFLDFDPVTRSQIALSTAIDNYLAGYDVGGQLGAGAYRQFPVVKLDKAFDAAVNVQILVS